MIKKKKYIMYIFESWYFIALNKNKNLILEKMLVIKYHISVGCFKLFEFSAKP